MRGLKVNPEPFPVISGPGPADCACGESPVRETARLVGAPGEGGQRPLSRSKAAVYGMWGLAGLTGLAVLVFGSGIFFGLDADLFWREVFSNLTFVLKAVWSILPFFMVSVAISAWVTVSGFSERINAVFKRREPVAIAGAAVVGATVPLCSCGVIPLIAALLAGGVPLGPVMAFWLSSPLMSPSKFFITAGMLGMSYAVARLLAAIVIGAGAGYLIFLLSSRGVLNDQLHGLSFSAGACCGSDEVQNETGETGGFWKSFWPELAKVSLFLGKWLLVAYALESLIVHYVDPGWISFLLGKDQFYSIPLATAVGIPMYTSGVSAVPIVQGLINSGMSPGAAMAFLVAGPVTTIPAMTAVFAIVKRRTFAIYLGAGIVGALISGYAFQIYAG